MFTNLPELHENCGLLLVIIVSIHYVQFRLFTAVMCFQYRLRLDHSLTIPPSDFRGRIRQTPSFEPAFYTDRMVLLSP